jgi:hypothetical protein
MNVASPDERDLAQVSQYVEVAPEVLGKAIPPLHDGYRHLLLSITQVSLPSSKKRKVTDRARNCAARILGYLNYRAKTGSPQGVQSSRAKFQELFCNEYGVDVIEVAQALLIASKLVLPPSQDHSTDRAFRWCLDVPRLRNAFAQLATSQPAQDASRHRNRPSLQLVERTYETTPESANQRDDQTPALHHDFFQEGKSPLASGDITASAEITGTDEVMSPHAQGDFAVSMPGNRSVHAATPPCACGENVACNREILEKEERQREIPPLPPEGVEGKEGYPHLQQQEATRGHPSMDTPPSPLIDEPESPEGLLALFDRLRGYPLPANLLPHASEAAQLLCYGNEQAHQLSYSAFQVEQTFLYLRYHDPIWQKNYKQYCSRTGIPDIWLVARHIQAKWPLALRRLLEFGDYHQLEDGTLVDNAAYQQYLQDKHEEWQQEQMASEGILPPIVDAAREQPSRDVLADPTLVPESQAGPFGWKQLSLARQEARRLRRAFPAYYHIALQPSEDDNRRWAIKITNSCLEDDSALVTCHRHVCALLSAAQQAQACPQPGWGQATIPTWWVHFLSKQLPAVWQITVDELPEGFEIHIITPEPHVIRLQSDEQVASFLRTISQPTSPGARSRRRRRKRTTFFK